MFKIEKTNYGIKLIFEGILSENEITEWYE